MSGAPCEGVTHLLFPEIETEIKDDDGNVVDVVVDDDLDAPAPDFCMTCTQSLDCLKRGWREKHGIWGGFTLIERRKAQKQKLSEGEIWSTKFQSDT